ncbi:LCP family protein [Guptibacillus algicola]|uniref:LCP family protein n=1 Tax=Guptibacillus algicola TaxID=225844 RepID=UPI001CD60167|nr:LCP family protein [Alkalihalobacillus algicola]MCA0987670.1 LCP family protein [Alkalihalobacillus algicola]
MNERYERRLKRRRKRSLKRSVLIVLTFLVIGVTGYGGYLFYKVSAASNQSMMEPERGTQSDLREEGVDIGKDHFSVLLLGVDDREASSEGRSDAMMVATFNQDDKSMKLLSIPRDSYVEIPGQGMDKITHAHAKGGIDLTIQTVEGMLGIPIDEVVRVNFDAFKTVIDEIGGIDVSIEKQSVVDQLYKESKGDISLNVGENTLDGEEALAYARTRKADSDIMRGQRQMDVITASIDKLSSLSSVPKYGGVLERIGENLTMSMSFKEALSLYPFVSNLKSIDKIQLSGENYQPGSTYYLKLDENTLSNAKMELKNHLNIEGSSENLNAFSNEEKAQ